MNPIVLEAREFAIQAHGDQMYGSQPYSTHLDAVVGLLQDAGLHNTPELVTGYLHDVLEDTEVTLDQIHRRYGCLVADAVAFCTDEPGPNRKSRKAATYARVLANPNILGTYVKWADRLANLRESVKNNSRLSDMYLRESPRFKEVYTPARVDRFLRVLIDWYDLEVENALSRNRGVRL